MPEQSPDDIKTMLAFESDTNIDRRYLPSPPPSPTLAPTEDGVPSSPLVLSLMDVGDSESDSHSHSDSTIISTPPDSPPLIPTTAPIADAGALSWFRATSTHLALYLLDLSDLSDYLIESIPVREDGRRTQERQTQERQTQERQTQERQTQERQTREREERARQLLIQKFGYKKAVAKLLLEKQPEPYYTGYGDLSAKQQAQEHLEAIERAHADLLILGDEVQALALAKAITQAATQMQARARARRRNQRRAEKRAEERAQRRAHREAEGQGRPQARPQRQSKGPTREHKVHIPRRQPRPPIHFRCSDGLARWCYNHLKIT